MEVASTKSSAGASMEVVEDAVDVNSTEVYTKALSLIFRLYFRGSHWQLPRKVGNSAASTKAYAKAFRESFRSSFHEKLKATVTEFTFYFH